MPRTSVGADASPDWPGLMLASRSRAGFFTPADALAHRVSPQLLRYRVARGWAVRELRGVYRCAGVPPTEHDELIALGLWSGDEATLSHVTALALHGLSDALPAKIHMTVPTSWRHARFAKPRHLMLHISELRPDEGSWLGLVRVTSVARTLADCVAARVSATLVEQALSQARKRGLLSAAEHRHLASAHRRACT